MNRRVLFTNQTVEQIILETNRKGFRLTRGKKKYLKENLNAFALYYYAEIEAAGFKVDHLPIPTYRSIARTADKLFKLLSLPDGKKLPDPPDTLTAEEFQHYRTDQRYEDRLIDFGLRLPPGTKDAVLTIANWANMASRNLSSLRSKKTSGRKRNYPLDEYIRNLFGLWMDVFEEIPSLSTVGGSSPKAGNPSGPFYRFIVACCREVGISNRGLFDRARRVVGSKGKTRKK